MVWHTVVDSRYHCYYTRYLARLQDWPGEASLIGMGGPAWHRLLVLKLVM